MKDNDAQHQVKQNWSFQDKNHLTLAMNRSQTNSLSIYSESILKAGHPLKKVLQKIATDKNVMVVLVQETHQNIPQNLKLSGFI